MKKVKVEDFMQKFALPKFEQMISTEITDLFFLYVQSDKELMKKYLDLVAGVGDLQYVNSSIAQSVARHFSLANAREENHAPVSNLIQSYSQLKKESE